MLEDHRMANMAIVDIDDGIEKSSGKLGSLRMQGLGSLV